jgi:hypothetical protein
LQPANGAPSRRWRALRCNLYIDARRPNPTGFCKIFPRAVWGGDADRLIGVPLLARRLDPVEYTN